MKWTDEKIVEWHKKTFPDCTYESQLYKMAGNSIVVDVLMGIFNNLFMQTEEIIEPELL